MNTSHWGRVLGPVGLVLLLAAVLTIVVSGDTGLGYVNVAMGLGCIFFYLVSNFRQLNQFASGRGTFFMVATGLTAVVLTGGLVALNYLAVKHPKTWDLTQNKIYTFAPETLKTLTDLKTDVKVVGYFQEGERSKDEFDDLLKRYHALNEKFSYRFTDPTRDPAAVKQYNIRESGPRVIVSCGTNDEKVTNATEEELTNAIVKALHSTEKKVYFLSGHGEVALDDRSGVGLSSLQAHMTSEGLKSDTLILARTPEIPADASVVVVAGPQKPLSEAEVGVLRKYLDAGGKLMLLVEPMTPSGLEPLLQEYGVTVDPGIVADPSAERLTQSVFIPMVLEYGEHDIVKQIQAQTMFPSAASLTVSPVSGVSDSPLLRTGARSWVESDPRQEPVHQDSGEKGGPLVLGSAFTKSTAKAEAASKRSDEARLVVIGDRDFLTNGGISIGGNEDLALNALNWLGEQVERISIRPRSRDASRVYLTQLQIAGIRFAATELPIALLAFGLIVFFNRRAK